METEASTTPRKSKASKNTSITKIIKQRIKNPLLTITDQAHLNGIHPSALTRLLQRHGIDHHTVETFKECRADIFAGKQELILSHINEDEIKRMVEKAPMAAVTLLNSCFNNERLERDLSTSNVASVIKDMAALKAAGHL